VSRHLPQAVPVAAGLALTSRCLGRVRRFNWSGPESSRSAHGPAGRAGSPARPFERLATMCAARNQVFRGRWLRCITVPAVTEVWRPPSAHFRDVRLRLRDHPRNPLHAGRTKPCGHRRLAKYCAHTSSAGNKVSKDCRNMHRRLSSSERATCEVAQFKVEVKPGQLPDRVLPDSKGQMHFGMWGHECATDPMTC